MTAPCDDLDCILPTDHVGGCEVRVRPTQRAAMVTELRAMLDDISATGAGIYDPETQMRANVAYMGRMRQS